MKKYSKVVFVDQNESTSLPDNISKALSGAGGAMPLLVFMSPDGETNYGSFNHGTLKNQKYSKIFKDVKDKIKTAKEEGKLKESGLVAKADDGDSDDKKAESDAVVILNPEVRTWKSSKGSEIKAKLIKFEDETYYFVTTKAKTIKVKASDLDSESVKMADEILRLNTK
jgi:hypothetical protein